MTSSDRSAGRKKGASAPRATATDAMAGSSVETITRSKQPDACAASIDQAMMGRPQNSRTFFRGIRLLPPRAGITPSLIVPPGSGRARPSAGACPSPWPQIAPIFSRFASIQAESSSHDIQWSFVSLEYVKPSGTLVPVLIRPTSADQLWIAGRIL